MTPVCPACSAILLNEGDVCTSCLQDQAEQSLVVAKDRAEQQPLRQGGIDAFVELEASLRSVQAARAIVDELVTKAKTMENPAEQAKVLQTCLRAVASLGTCTSKLSKEALVWQEKRHKVAQAMSVDDEMVRVQRWFHKKLNVFQMKALLDTLIANYQERTKKNRERRPWNRESSGQ